MSWPLVNLGELGNINAGGTPSRSNRDYWGEGIKWLSIRDYKEFDYVTKTSETITQKGLENSSAKIFPKGSVIISIFATLGRVAILGEEMATNQAIAAIQCSDAVDSKYLMYCLKSKIHDIEKQAGGVAQKNINLSILKGLKIPLPPLSIQKQIAAVLEKTKQLRVDCQQMEKELNKLAQSLFIDMFGDPVSNPKGWPKVELAEMVESKDDIKCGPFGTQLAKSEFKLTGVPLWGIKNVNNGFRTAPHEFVSKEKAKDLHTYSIKAGDIVMTRKGNVGNCHIYPAHLENGIMHSDLLRIRPSKNKVDSNFLQKQFMYSRDVEDQLRLISQGAIMAGINVTKLKSLILFYPPIDLQEKFSNIISKIDAQLAVLAKVQQEHQENFNSLMQKAFNGELKLKLKAA